MATPLTAKDLWPLVRKLPQAEQLKLAKLTLGLAARGGQADADAYAAHPAGEGEFSSEDDALAWEGEGWDDIDATG